MDKWTVIPHGYPKHGVICLIAFDHYANDSREPWRYTTGDYDSERNTFYMPDEGFQVEGKNGVAWIEIEAPE